MTHTTHRRLLRAGVGARVLVRTRWGGLRYLRVRIIGRSTSNKLYIVGSTDNDICHRAWMGSIIRIEQP